MKFARCLLALALPVIPLQAHASPAEAARIRKSWDLAMEKWALESRAATTPEARAALLAKQPDTMKTAAEMWRQIGPALDQEWVLEHVAWFLRVAPPFFSTGPNGARVQVFSEELTAVFKALETRHLASKGMVPVCMALASFGDPRTLPLLEKIISSHPETKTQGVAALAAAIVLRTLGDERDLIRKRLIYLTKAIKDSTEVEISPNATVGDLARDELYIIRFLSKGQVAPDLTGTDSAGRPFKLSDHAGKTIILLFWSGNMNEADHTIRMMNEMHARFQGRPVVMLGVNRDPLEQLRKMEGEGTVVWRNFSDPSDQLARNYRVGTWPIVYVLDGERRIQYAGAPGSFAELTVEALLSESPAQGAE